MKNECLYTLLSYLGKEKLKKKKRLTRNAGIFRERFQLFC